MADVRYQYRGVGLGLPTQPGGWLENYVRTRLPLEQARASAVKKSGINAMSAQELTDFIEKMASHQSEMAGRQYNVVTTAIQGVGKTYSADQAKAASDYAAAMAVRREAIKQDATTYRLNKDWSNKIVTSRFTTEGDRRAVDTLVMQAAQAYNNARAAGMDVTTASASAAQTLADGLNSMPIDPKVSPLHYDAVRAYAADQFAGQTGYKGLEANDKLAFNAQVNQHVYDAQGVPVKKNALGEASVDQAYGDDSYLTHLVDEGRKDMPRGGPGTPFAPPQSTPTSGPHLLHASEPTDKESAALDIMDADGQYAYRVQLSPTGQPVNVQVIKDPHDEKVTSDAPKNVTDAKAQQAIVQQAADAWDNARKESGAESGAMSSGYRLQNGMMLPDARSLADAPSGLYGAVFDPYEDVLKAARSRLKGLLDGTIKPDTTESETVGYRLFRPDAHPDQERVDKIATYNTANPNDAQARLNAVQAQLAAFTTGTSPPPMADTLGIAKRFDKAHDDLDADIANNSMVGTLRAAQKQEQLLAQQSQELAALPPTDASHVLDAMSNGDKLRRMGLRFAAPQGVGQISDISTKGMEKAASAADRVFAEDVADPWRRRFTPSTTEPAGVRTSASRFAEPTETFTPWDQGTRDELYGTMRDRLGQDRADELIQKWEDEKRKRARLGLDEAYNEERGAPVPGGTNAAQP